MGWYTSIVVQKGLDVNPVYCGTCISAKKPHLLLFLRSFLLLFYFLDHVYNLATLVTAVS